jgi:hypothetical protein
LRPAHRLEQRAGVARGPGGRERNAGGLLGGDQLEDGRVGRRGEGGRRVARVGERLGVPQRCDPPGREDLGDEERDEEDQDGRRERAADGAPSRPDAC